MFLPGESCGQRSLAGYNQRVKESDITKQLSLHFFQITNKATKVEMSKALYGLGLLIKTNSPKS